MRTLLTLTVAATVLGTGLALKCYQCNSYENKECMDLVYPKAYELLKECGDNAEGEKYTLCRKLDMHLDMDFGPLHPAENRIHRACGYEENVDAQDCYYKSGYNTRTWVCACKDDGCNSASLLSTTVFLLPLAALVGVLRVFF